MPTARRTEVPPEDAGGSSARQDRSGLPGDQAQAAEHPPRRNPQEDWGRRLRQDQHHVPGPDLRRCYTEFTRLPFFEGSLEWKTATNTWGLVTKGLVSNLTDSQDGTETASRRWTGARQRVARGSRVTVKLDPGGARLVLETNSVARGSRGREVVESAAAGAIRHRATTHEDLTQRIKDFLRTSQKAWSSIILHATTAPGSRSPCPPSTTHRRVRPRRIRRSKRKLVDLLRGLVAMYQQALRDGSPAYDPSWMWAELGLADEAAAAHPPELAHERVAAMVPRSVELVRALADETRDGPASPIGRRSCRTTIA